MYSDARHRGNTDLLLAWLFEIFYSLASDDPIGWSKATLQRYVELHGLGSHVNSVAEKLVGGATHRAAIISLPTRITHGYYSDSLATTNIPRVISQSTMMSLTWRNEVVGWVFALRRFWPRAYEIVARSISIAMI